MTAPNTVSWWGASCPRAGPEQAARTPITTAHRLREPLKASGNTVRFGIFILFSTLLKKLPTSTKECPQQQHERKSDQVNAPVSKTEYNLADSIVPYLEELCHQGGYARLGESINETGRRTVFKGTDDLVGEPSRRIGLQGVDVILCRVKFVKRASESEVLRETSDSTLLYLPRQKKISIYFSASSIGFMFFFTLSQKVCFIVHVFVRGGYVNLNYDGFQTYNHLPFRMAPCFWINTECP